MKLSTSTKSEDNTKIKVCWHFLALILGDLDILTDNEKAEIKELDIHNPKVLLEIIREYVVPHFQYYLPENQAKIRNTLTFYLATDNEKLSWPFITYYIPLDVEIAKLFYTLIWKELFGTEGPDPIDPNDYEEDCSSQYSKSLTWSYALKKQLNPENVKPSLSNVFKRLK